MSVKKKPIGDQDAVLAAVCANPRCPIETIFERLNCETDEEKDAVRDLVEELVFKTHHMVDLDPVSSHYCLALSKLGQREVTS